MSRPQQVTTIIFESPRLAGRQEKGEMRVDAGYERAPTRGMKGNIPLHVLYCYRLRVASRDL